MPITDIADNICTCSADSGVVYGTLALAESLVDTTFSWMPFYYLGKIVFMGWCFHPQTKGALVIYQRVLAPLFGQLQAQVESVEAAVDSASSKQPAVQAPGGPKSGGQRQSTSTSTTPKARYG